MLLTRQLLYQLSYRGLVASRLVLRLVAGMVTFQGLSLVSTLPTACQVCGPL